MKTDEQLMVELEALEYEEFMLGRDGREDEIPAIHAEGTAIYNELKRRGWKWNDSEKEWVRA
jgi:hypothetical protein